MQWKKFALTLTISCSMLFVYAQNPQFKQLYSHRAYINPAMIGLGNYDQIQANRISSGVKAKWVGVNRRLNTTYIAGDVNINNTTSFGINVDATDFLSSDKGGREYSFNHFHAAATYSYLLKTDNINWKFGLAIDVSNFSFGSADFIWGDQINEDMTAFINPTQEPLDNLSHTKIHAAAGALALGKKWFAGFSVFNINQPNISFYDQNPQPLFRKFMVHGGYRFKRSYSNLIFTPTLFYAHQNSTNQYAIDANFQQGNILYGVGARQMNFNNSSSNSLHTFFQVRKSRWVVGYDVDFNLSLNNSSLPLTHEFTLVYLMPTKERNTAVYNLPTL